MPPRSEEFDVEENSGYLLPLFKEKETEQEGLHEEEEKEIQANHNVYCVDCLPSKNNCSFSSLTMTTATTTASFEAENYEEGQGQRQQKGHRRRRRQVRFNLRQNIFYDSESGRTRGEHEQCFYKEQEVEGFRQEASQAAMALFGNHNNNNNRSFNAASPDINKKNNNKKKRPGLFWRRKRWAESSKDTWSSQRQEQPHCNCKLTMYEAYGASMQAVDVTIAPPPAKHVDALERIYSDVDDLWGLELASLSALRGTSPVSQVEFILQTVQQKQKQHRQQQQRQEADNGNDGDDDDDYALYQYWMGLTSRYVSLPSRVFCHELALAQAQAVSSL